MAGWIPVENIDPATKVDRYNPFLLAVRLFLCLGNTLQLLRKRRFLHSELAAVTVEEGVVLPMERLFSN